MEINLFNNSLKVYEDGTILVKKTSGFCERKDLSTNGYLYAKLNYKKTRRAYAHHRLVAYVYLGLDIDNTKLDVDHIDRNRLNNCVSNLRVVSKQQNAYNQGAKGYYWYEQRSKWVAQISIERKNTYLGCFDTEEEAHQAYLDAKLIYHII